MRKFTAAVTAVLLFVTMLALPVAAEVSYSGTATVPEGVDYGEHIAVWSTYMFFTGENGITIADMQKNTVEGKWIFTDGEVLGVSNFIPTETEVTDDYILVSNKKSVAVFNNAKGFSNEVPMLVCRITKDYDEMQSFGNIKNMIIADNNLFIFDKTSDGAEVAKISLDGLSDVSYEDDDIKIISAASCGEIKSLGNCDYLWGNIKSNGEKIYAVTYNDTAEPQKTLTLKGITVEDFSICEENLISDIPSGLYAEIDLDGNVDEEAFLESTIGKEGSDAEYTLKAFVEADSEYVTYTIEDNKATVRFNPAALTALASLFECSTAEIENNQVIITINGTAFLYSDNNDKYEMGCIALNGDDIFVHTNSKTTANKLIAISDEDGELQRESIRPAVDANGGTGANDMFVVDSSLVALYRNANSMAIVYDVSNPGNIPTNASGQRIQINGTVKLGDYAEVLKWGNGYYYLAGGSNGLGMIMTDGTARTVEVSYSDGSFPIKLYGFGVDGETVTVNVDDEFEAETTVTNGLWSYDIYSVAPGEHTILVDNGGYTKTVTVTTTLKEPVSLSVMEQDSMLYITMTNNTHKYGKVLSTENFKLIAYIFDADGEVFMMDKCTVSNLKYGTSRLVVPAVMDYDFEIGDTVELMVTDNDGNPLSAGVYGALTGYTNEAFPDIYGEVGNITLQEGVIDYANKEVTIKGHVDTDCARLVYVTVGGAVAYEVTKAIVTDENGDFTYIYMYGDDYMHGDATYAISARVIGGNLDNVGTSQFTIMDNTNFETALAELKDKTSGAEVKSYLEEKRAFSKILGADLGNEDYGALSDEDKEAVMAAVLTEVKNGSKNVTSVYNETATRLRLEARQDKAMKALKADTTTKATLTGVLEEYNDVFEISDRLWKKYSEHKKIQDINEKFIRYINSGQINSVDSVAGKLEDAIEYVENDGNGGGGKVTPSGGLGGKMEIDNSIAVGDNGLKTPTFTDLSTAAWAEKAINYLASKGIIKGIGGGKFAPDNSVTRCEFVKMLIEAFNLYDSAAEADFTDVPKNHWAYKYVASAYKYGLTNGKGDGSFGTDETITREEMATMAYRAMKIAGKQIQESNVTFADKDSISTYAASAVGAMSNAGIINGVGNNRFAPKSDCSRAMAAKVIYEILN